MKKYWWIELFLLLLIFLNFYYAITNYPALPDKIPMHFGADGKADGWHTKSWASVLGISYAAVGMDFLLLIATLVITKSKKDPLRFVNLPISRSRISTLPQKAIEEIAGITVQLLVIIKSIIIVMFSYMSYSTIQIALKGQGTLGVIIWLFVAALFIVVFWETIRLSEK